MAEFEVDESRVLGQGVLGPLLFGRRISDARNVALRFLAEDLTRDPAFDASFKRLMEGLGALKGEGIVSVLGHGLLAGRAFFASELIEGESLFRHLSGGARFTTEDILHVARGIGEALRDAGKAGFCHGRLRPSCVFLASDGKVRLADLGLAELFPSTQRSRWLGNGERYLAPEQVNGGTADSRTDVYALGTLLYELATGRPPFEGHASATSFQFQLIHEPPVPPREAGSTVPRELERLILRCLEKEPENRFAGPGELLTEIEETRRELLSIRTPASGEEDDLGDFQVDEERVIGEGGMGTLYRGRQRALGRDVAIKVIRPLLLVYPEIASRFRREAELLAQLNDGNIVQVFGTGLWKGRLFYAMELLEGKDLSAMMAEKASFPEKLILHVAEGVGNALRAAWKRRIVHRDIKPSNILITTEGIVKVADFGLAKSLRVEGAASAAVLGTLAYLSPEQATGKAVDVRSDIYSLGVVLYELASGKPPFGWGPPTRVLYQHAHAVPPALEPVRPISGGLKALIEQCLQKDASDRYQSPDELLKDVEALKNGSATAGPRAPRTRATPTTTSAWMREYAFHVSLGDFAKALRIAEDHGGPDCRESAWARELARAADLRDLERGAVDRLLQADWAGAAEKYQALLEAKGSTTEVDHAPALRCCRDLARAAEYERSGEWDRAAAIYAEYVDLDPGPPGHVRERLDSVAHRSGTSPR